MKTKMSPFVLFIVTFSLIRTCIPFFFSEWGQYLVPSAELRAKILLENELVIQLFCLLGAHFFLQLAQKKGVRPFQGVFRFLKKVLNRRNLYILLQEFGESFRQNFSILVSFLFGAVVLEVANIESPHNLLASFAVSLWHSFPQLLLFAFWLSTIEYTKLMILRQSNKGVGDLSTNLVFAVSFEFYLVFCFLLSILNSFSVLILSLMAATWSVANFFVAYIRKSQDIDESMLAVKRVMSVVIAVFLSFFFFGFEFFGWRSVSFLQSFIQDEYSWSVTMSLFLFILLGKFALENFIALWGSSKELRSLK